METLLSFGVPEAEAKMYMEMAGGNAEMAVNLFLSMSGGGGGGGAPQAQAKDLGWEVPEWYTAVWPERENIPEAWLGQGLKFDEKCPIGIVQPKNGPCGVLAALQAVLIAQVRKKESNFSADYMPSEKDLANAIATMILQSKMVDAPAAVCVWSGNVGQGVKIERAESAEGVHKLVQENINQYIAPGGCVLLVYSAAHTRGIETIKSDVISEGGESGFALTMKAHGHWLCTSELVSLLIRGKAGGNVGAYSQLGGAQHDWDMKLGVGLLSADEFKNGIKVCDTLKNPSSPVWILHGGDHFTTLWSNSDLKDEKGQSHTLFHWNGLPPGGPRLSKISVDAKFGPAAKAPPKRVETYVKPQPGEIDNVVRAHPDDKKARPDMYDTWRYEVMLAVEDKSVSGGERPKDMPSEPKYEQGPITPGPWRCRACYADRFKTMYFKLNPDGAKNCEGPCGKPREEAGWSIWLEFKDLPASQKSIIHHREAPKIKNILWTKWPGSEIEYEDDSAFNGAPPSA